MERLKSIKETLMGCIQGQMSHLDSVDTKELGEAIDMIKDLEEAIYYGTITKSMKEKEGKEEKIEHHYYTEYRYPETMRDMDRGYGRMYFPETSGGRMNYPDMMYYNGGGGRGGSSSGGNSSSSGSSGGNSSGGNNAQGGGSRGFQEMPLNFIRDSREGRSPMSRRSYMESKEMHQDKAVQMKELEKYMQELTKDITDMIQDASPEEKQVLQQKISHLATKIQ